MFYIEAVGFGRGLGVLDINKDSISRCYLLNPALLTEAQKADILEKFSALSARGIIDINQEFNDPIRREFDTAVFNAYGIGEYYDRIVDSLKAMRKVRKAVKQKTVNLRPQRGIEDNVPQFELTYERAAEGDIPS